MLNNLYSYNVIHHTYFRLHLRMKRKTALTKVIYVYCYLKRKTFQMPDLLDYCFLQVFSYKQVLSKQSSIQT